MKGQFFESHEFSCIGEFRGFPFECRKVDKIKDVIADYYRRVSKFFDGESKEPKWSKVSFFVLDGSKKLAPHQLMKRIEDSRKEHGLIVVASSYVGKFREVEVYVRGHCVMHSDFNSDVLIIKAVIVEEIK